MIWVQFAIAAIIIFIAGSKLSRLGDIIAEKTGISHAWMGAFFLAMMTSLTELVTSSSSVLIEKAPNLALGNIFGSILFNIFLIAVLDLLNGHAPLFSKVGKRIFSSVFISILLLFLVLFFFIFKIRFQLYNVGINSIVIFFAYIISVRFLFKTSHGVIFEPLEEGAVKNTAVKESFK